MIDLSFNLPMAEAVDFWKQKLQFSPSEFFALEDDAKVLAFAVSGIAKGEELTTVYNALNKALIDGISFDQWKKEAAAVFEKRGWTGQRAWRLDTIFRTNIQTAYNVGRYQQMRQVKDARPYWRYSAVNDRRTRPAHRAMHGKIFPQDHPFWDTWYPPNGFRCRCSVNSVSPDDLDSNGWQVETKDPTGKLYEPTDPDTGVKMPARLLMPDPGFMSNPAKNFYEHADKVMADSLEKMEPRIAAKIRKEWDGFRENRTVPPPLTIHTNPTSIPFKQEVHEAVSTVSDKIGSRLRKSGYTVETGDLLVNMEPTLAGLTTRDGRPWEQVDGVFLPNGKRMLIAEKTVDATDGKTLIPSQRVKKVTLHEYGHAWDDLTGFSRLQVFRDAYKKDVALFNKPTRDFYGYFLQTNGVGEEEVFADVFADLHGHATYPGISDDFPQVKLLVAKLRK